jgi:hypothetical protein
MFASSIPNTDLSFISQLKKVKKLTTIKITENFNRVAGMLSPEEFANYKAGFLNHHDLIQGVDGNFKINPDAKVAQEGDFVVKPEFFAPGNQLKPSGM